jgi:hypothetical protein
MVSPQMKGSTMRCAAMKGTEGEDHYVTILAEDLVVQVTSGAFLKSSGGWLW